MTKEGIYRLNKISEVIERYGADKSKIEQMRIFIPFYISNEEIEHYIDKYYKQS